MRIWGRVYDELGNYTWTAVETTPSGNNDAVYVTNLIQVLKLSRGESPFFANWGIPAQLSIIQRIFPDIYVFQTQSQFAPFFASIIIAALGPNNAGSPVYQINILTHSGSAVAFNVPI